MENLCIRCKGCGMCGKPCRILTRFKEKAPRVKLHFSGSSPPEIFVGRINYPNVFSGILAPNEKGDTSILSTPEEWLKNDLTIEEILEMRGSLIYGRSQTHIKSRSNRLVKTTQEIALSSKSVSTEFFLKKPPQLNFTPDKVFSIIANPAPVERVILEENPKIEKKVDYLTSDYDVKSMEAIQELYKSRILISHLQKLLSAGLLGIKVQRKMVPTRWAITAVDDMLGKNLLEKIRYYQELAHIELFHYDYNGNHFEVLLLPDKFLFEVIEVSMSGSTWSEEIGAEKDVFMQDYESFYGRKTYAENVVGAYYADRLAVCEYLEKIKKQAICVLFHEERPEYYAPLGMGIIRESLRKMFLNMQETKELPSTIEEALIIMGMRLKASGGISRFKKMSWILNNYGKQRRLKDYL